MANNVAKSIDRRARLFFQHRVLGWFASHRRDFPWRRTRDPYRILVSEIMLQQTQVSRVAEKYRQFIKRFPTIRTLAEASTRDVIVAWQGLGYNRRALYLQQAARQIAWDAQSRWPRTRVGLLRLRGVGQATAGSLLAFAFNQDASSLDVNIKRVQHRFFIGVERPGNRLSEQKILALAESVVPRGRGYDWNQALMDFGSIQCTARRPACDSCPLRIHCRAFPGILTDTGGLRNTRDRREPAPSSTPKTPNRMYRGRVIEILRRQHRTIGLSRLALAIKSDYTADDAVWLASLLDKLAREGFITVIRDNRGRIQRISLR